jgi:hypothetical protein
MEENFQLHSHPGAVEYGRPVQAGSPAALGQERNPHAAYGTVQAELGGDAGTIRAVVALQAD